MTDKTIKEIQLRLGRLEHAVFGKKTQFNQTAKTTEDFSGPSGGLRLLISKGFFSEKRSLADVRAALAKNGYHYSTQAAQTALNRFSKTGGSLVSLKQDGKKVYVLRR
jgi:hypothetical protein